MKIYAQQVPPEYQESPFDYNDYTGIILTGNRDYKGIAPEWFDDLENKLSEALEEWEALQDGRGWYDNWAAVLDDLLAPDGREPYTRAERLEWAALVNAWPATHNGLEELRLILDALRLITGRRWEWRTLRGCCQGDWIDCYYPADDWSDAALDALEVEYFNTGTEWCIKENEDDPGYCQYCTGWNNDLIRAEIAETAGVNPADVILYEFNGWSRSASYKEVTA